MRRRLVDPPAARRFFHERYLSESEYLAALAARDERRRRLMAMNELERGELLSGPGEDVCAAALTPDEY